MMMEMANIGDFTVIANSTDAMAKIPAAGIACKIPKITVPSSCEVAIRFADTRLNLQCLT